MLLVLGWSLFGPVELGGPATYVVTSGISMQPSFHTGDLAILRVADTYQVGDTVAYRDPRIGRVLHRIIGEEGGRFVMKGDNNNFVDPYQPAPSDVLGKLWIHLPGAGKWLQAIQQPRQATAVATVAGMLLLGPIGVEQRRKRRRFGRGGYGSGRVPDRRGRGGASAGVLGPVGQVAAAAVAVLAALSLLLGAVAFTRPLERNTVGLLKYRQSGTFSYAAQAAGGVYDGNAVTTGQPIFRKLADKVDLRFDYGFSADLPAVVRGTYRLDAILSRQDGWSRTVPLVPETPFTGERATVSGTLDLGQLQALIDALQRASGASNQQSGQYAVSVVPDVRVTGTVGGAALDGTFAPALNFTLDPVELQLDRSSGLSNEADPLKPASDGLVRAARRAPNRLPLPLLQPTITAARRLAEVGLALALFGATVLAALAWRARHAEEPARIQARYGTLLITLRGSDLGAKGRLIDVATIEDLTRVADREGRMILHERSGRTHDYFVQDVDVTYRYRTYIGGAEPGRSMVETVR